MADLDALSQVFGNLEENAMKYGKAGGRVRVGAREQGARIEFYVQEFVRGVANAKHIVHAHGGDIRCESELGFGATFLFRLPRAAPAPAPPLGTVPSAS